MMNKQELRQYIRTQKKLHLTGDQSPCEVLLRHPHINASQTILAYSALPDEVPTQMLIDEWLRLGKTVLLPRVVNDTDMELRRYTGQHTRPVRCGPPSTPDSPPISPSAAT